MRKFWEKLKAKCAGWAAAANGKIGGWAERAKGWAGRLAEGVKKRAGSAAGTVNRAREACGRFWAHFQGLPKRVKLISVATAFAAVAGLCVAIAIAPGTAVPSDALDAVLVDDTFFAESRSVLLYTDGRISLNYLRQNLTTVNGEFFTVKRVADDVFSVRFTTQLQQGKAVLLQLQAPKGTGAARQFALRVQAESKALQMRLVYRGDTDEVGIGDPILLMFSQDIPRAQLQKHLQLSSDVKTSIRVVNNVAVIQPDSPLEYDRRYSLSVSSGLQVGGEVLRQSFSTQFVTRAQTGFRAQDFAAVSHEQPVEEGKWLTVEALPGNSTFGSFDVNGTFTLVFSEAVTESALRKSMEIDPMTGYMLTIRDRTVIVTPNAALDPATTYTLSIAPDLISAEGAALRSRFVLQATTQKIERQIVKPQVSSFSVLLTNESNNIVSSTKPVVLEFAMETTGADHCLAEISLLRMNNYKQYRKLLSVSEITQDYHLPVVSTTMEVLRNGLNSVELENPGSGIYLAKISMKDPMSNSTVTIYKCLNITDLSVYLQVANDRTLAWVNSATTPAPQSGLRVELSDRMTEELMASGITGADGTCELTYAEAMSKKLKYTDDCILTIYNAAGEAIYADATSTIGTGLDAPDDSPRYYTFFFTDRTLYHPTDTIRFWGYIKPYLLNKEPMPSTMRVYFDRGGLDEYADVYITPDGVFSGEISIEQVQSSQYSLSAYLFDPTEKEEEKQLTYLDELWLEAKDFEKPTFVLSATTVKDLVAAPDEVRVVANLKFYDGTPVPDFPLELSVMNLTDGNVQELLTAQTDKFGTARFYFQPDAGIGEKLQNGPVESYYTVTLADQGETQRVQGSYAYQMTKLVMDAQVDVESSSQLKLTVRTNEPNTDSVDKEKLTTLLQEGWDYDYYSSYGTTYLKRLHETIAGTPADTAFEAAVTIRYQDTLGGMREQSFPLSAMTKGGVYEQALPLEVLCDPAYNVQAQISLQCVDDNLNQITAEWESNTVPPEPDVEPQDEEKEEKITGYSLSITKAGEEKPLPVAMNYMGYNDQLVDMGDNLTLQLCYNGVPVPNNGKLLYQLIQEQPLSSQVTTEASFQMQEQLSYAQSVHVVAAYFDGAEVHPVYDTALRINLDSVELDIAVVPDQQTYRPGDTVNLGVQVRDKNGNPVAGNLCVSVVDESIFALKEQELNVVNELYWRLSFSGIYFKKYTTGLGDIERQFTGGDGGKGGGGIEAYDLIREDFKDTAFFYPTKTDAAGNAQISFKLPDNTTSWRITTVSVGGSLYGGSGKENIISTLPFYSKPLITSKYLVGDEVVMLAQSFGTLLEEDSQVTYQVRVQGDGVDKTFTETHTAFEAARISFGQLEAGEYTVSSTAQFQQYRDTVVLPLSVITNNLEMLVAQEVAPPSLPQLNVARYPVSAMYFDDTHAAFYKSVNQLLAQFCGRADQRLARYVAKKALMRYMPQAQVPDYMAKTDDYIADLQQSDGGIGWHEGEGADLLLTSKALLAVGPQFNTKRMLKYYNRQLEENYMTGEKRAAAYAGLAVLDPANAVKEITEILKENEDLPLQEQLYYITGLAVGGDRQQALNLYSLNIAPLMKKADNGGRYVAFSESKTQNEQLTAAAWLAATKLRLADADDIALYFANTGWRTDHILECMAYVADYTKAGRGIAPIQYSVNGAGRSLSLGVAGQAWESYNKSELNSLRFTNISSNVSALAYFIGEPDEAGRKPSQNILVEKSIEKQADGSYLNTLRVELTAGAATGEYNISDWIPSNMRFFSMQNPSSTTYEQELQKLYFTFYHSETQRQIYTITYVTRETFQAKTMQDRAYVINVDGGEYGYSERKAL